MPIEKLKSENDALNILNSELKLEIQSLKDQLKLLQETTGEIVHALQQGEIEKNALQERLKKMTLIFGKLISKDSSS